MLWLLLILSVLAGLHFAPELSGPLALSASELRLLIVGALTGLLLAFVIGAPDTWLANTRRRSQETAPRAAGGPRLA